MVPLLKHSESLQVSKRKEGGGGYKTINNLFINLACLSVCLFVCLFVSNKRKNG